MISPRRSTARVRIERVRDGVPRGRQDVVAVEEPLEIRVQPGSGEEHRVAITMRTPGDDFELAAGFLHGEGLLAGPGDVGEIRYCTNVDPQEFNVVTVHLRPGASFDPTLLDRNFYTTSSCGVCGKASLEAIEISGCAPLPTGDGRLDAETIRRLPDAVRERQAVFERTGGLHAAGLFDLSGDLLDIREDVGRHNAVDKIVGHAFLERRLPLAGRVLAVSGRASFEIMQKALAAGIAIVVAVGAPSSLAVDLSREFRITLVGFAKSDGFNVYAGPERLRLEGPGPDA